MNIMTSNKKKIIIGGDLNARAKLWDNTYNARGFILEEWVDRTDMMILNDGKMETCVRAQGSSRVDVTIATEAAAKEIREWEVDVETDTLSDHRYIRFSIEEKTLAKLDLGRKYSPNGI